MMIILVCVCVCVTASLPVLPCSDRNMAHDKDKSLNAFKVAPEAFLSV